MAKFRKKPVVIEAEQWLGAESKIEGVREATKEEIAHHIHLFAQMKVVRETEETGRLVFDEAARFFVIETLEGLHFVSPGDWIITGVKGEKYPCKPDIFAATYEMETDAKERTAGGYGVFGREEAEGDACTLKRMRFAEELTDLVGPRIESRTDDMDVVIVVSNHTGVSVIGHADTKGSILREALEEYEKKS